MPKVIQDDRPPALKQFLWHGVALDWSGGNGQSLGDCPWCGKRKFGVNTETAEWQCLAGSCGKRGNGPTWPRAVWEESTARGDGHRGLEELARDRGLLSADTLKAWGVVRSFVTGEWLVPGWGTGGKLDQLYRYPAPVSGGKPVLLCGPTYKGHSGQPIGHALFAPLGTAKEPVPPVTRETVYVCEGPWDGMALWEVMGRAKRDGDGGALSLTGNAGLSLLAGADVVAVPGANAMPDHWLPLFKERDVVLLYDNDYPRKDKTGKVVPGAGYAGMKRVTGLMCGGRNAPRSVKYLCWGEGEFGEDRELKDGHDVRDGLTKHTEAGNRVFALEDLHKHVAPIPADWVPGRTAGAVAKGETTLRPLECRSWRELTDAWKRALQWRDELGDVLAVMLAVAISTEQVGDQLFLQVIGDAGGGKTRLCDGMLVSRNCYALEHITGFHSGWNDGTGEDYSLLARINGKTLVTPEGDVLMGSPRMAEIMSQQRRIFDGTSGASYKNRKEDLRYTGLRTPWIIAGTPALLDVDQSRLGDRFLRIVIGKPAEDELDVILNRAGLAAWDDVTRTSNCAAGSQMSEKMRKAQQLTGGYIDHLRRNSGQKLAEVGGDPGWVVGECKTMARLTAELRARPHVDPRKDVEATKELPTRLTQQYVRLARCLAAVLMRAEVDDRVLRVVRKVALDTCWRRSRELAGHLHAAGKEGLLVDQVSLLTGRDEETELRLLKFLRDIGTVERFRPSKEGNGAYVPGLQRWRLTQRVGRLYERVVNEEGY